MSVAHCDSHLSKTGSVDRLRVVLLAEVQVVHVEGAPGDAHSLCYLIILF